MKVRLERDTFVRSVPDEVQVAIISFKDYSCLLETPKLIEKLFPDAHARSASSLDCQTISNEKFRDCSIGCSMTDKALSLRNIVARLRADTSL